MTFMQWCMRTFTRTGRDIAWRERFARRRGYAYPGHVPPRPMPAPAPESKMLGPNVNPDPSPRPMRAPYPGGGYQPLPRPPRADGRPHPEPLPPPKDPLNQRRYHHTMFIVAGEAIAHGQVIYLDACSDGSFVARVRPIPGAPHA